MIKKEITFLVFLLAFTIAIMGCGKSEAPKTETKKEDKKTETVANQNQTKKDTIMDTKKEEVSGGDVVKMETSMGTFKFKMFPSKAPQTVARIKELVSQGFYDGIIFHRIIAGFMIQGGDPTGTGRGGSGKSIPDEFTNGLKHDKAGMVAMAHSQAPNSQDSQFYITLAPAPHLDNGYTVFGEVTEGLKVVMDIGVVKTGPGDKPEKDVKIIKATLEK